MMHHGEDVRLTVCRLKRANSSRIFRHSTEIARRNSKNAFPSLGQGVFQPFRSFLQLALERIDLLRYIIKLFLSQRTRPCHLLDFAIRLAHGRPNFHRNSREPALFSHRKPPSGTEPSYTRTIPSVINPTGWTSQIQRIVITPVECRYRELPHATISFDSSNAGPLARA